MRKSTTRAWSLGIDVGGTFTDLAVISAGEVIATAKVLTTYPDPITGIAEGVEAILSSGLDAGECEAVIHATTLASNAVLEGKYARAGLISTAGFADTLWLRREYRFDTYSLDNRFPPVPIDPSDRIDANERITASGEVLEPLTVAPVIAEARRLAAAGVESFAICLLHAYANPVHERVLADALREALPGVGVVISSDVLSAAREYERGIATVLDAVLQPVMSRYLDALGAALRDRGLRCPHYAVSSAGDALTFQRAARHPVLMLESGPAAGHVAACHIARRLGREVVAFDVGGTTAKVAVSVDGRPRLTRTLEVARTARLRAGSGYPVALRSVELNEIGSGGGSIARIDTAGLLEVGPESAASDPGPACFGLGGTEPTVTDANLRLGYLSPEARLGGRLQIDLASADRVLATLDADADARGAASAVRRLLDEKMAEACRLHLVETQASPRDRVLIASGGGGPLHAAFVAERIGIDTIFCSREAGILSAWGLGLARLALRSTVTMLLTPGEADFEQQWREVWADALERLDLEPDAQPVSFEREVEMCYDGQAFSLDVELGTAAEAGEPVAAGDLERRFAQVYRDAYHRDVAGARPVITGVQLTAILREEVRLAPLEGLDELVSAEVADPAERAAFESREAIFDGVTVEAAVVPWPRDGRRLAISGPAIVVADYTAAIVPPDWSAVAVGDGDLLLRKNR